MSWSLEKYRLQGKGLKGPNPKRNFFDFYIWLLMRLAHIWLTKAHCRLEDMQSALRTMKKSVGSPSPTIPHNALLPDTTPGHERQDSKRIQLSQT